MTNDMDLNNLDIHFSTTSILNNRVKFETLPLLSSLPITDIPAFVLSLLIVSYVKKNLLTSPPMPLVVTALVVT